MQHNQLAVDPNEIIYLGRLERRALKFRPHSLLADGIGLRLLWVGVRGELSMI